MTDVTVTTEAPQNNSPEARTESGELKAQTNIQPSETKTETRVEGGSTFLTQKPEAKQPEAKPEATGDKKPEAETKPEAKVEGAPEKYGDFKLPDGYTFDPSSLTAAQSLFKELNLTQEGAQKLVDMYAKNGIDTARAPFDLWANTQTEWHKEILSRFGGEDGAARMSADINKVIDSTLPPSLQKTFRAALDFTGAGSNPDLLEGLSIILKPLMEGKPVKGGNPTEASQTAPKDKPTGPRDIAADIYPHLVKNRTQ